MTAFLECWMSNGGSQLSDPWFSHATQSGKVWVQWELWVSSRNSGYWKFNKIFTICPYNNFFPYEHSIFSLFQWIQTLKKCIWMYNVCITDGDFATLQISIETRLHEETGQKLWPISGEHCRRNHSSTVFSAGKFVPLSHTMVLSRW